MSDIDGVEQLKVGKLDLNPESHDGFSFVDSISTLGHRLRNLRHSDTEPGMLEADLTIFDEVGDMTDPQPVILPDTRLEEARSFNMFIKEHKKGIMAGSASVLAGGVAVGSLVLYRKLKSAKQRKSATIYR